MVDPDYGWHVENGRHLSDGLLLGGHDIYSWTSFGRPWVAHEWLTDVAMAKLDGAFGPTANGLAASFVIVLAFGIVAARLRNRRVTSGVILATIVLGALSSYGSLGARPQMLELLYLALTLWLVESWIAGRVGGPKLVALVGVGALIWANTHGSFLLLCAICGLTAIARFLAHDGRWRWMLTATVVAAVVPLANPFGLQLYAFASQSARSAATQRLIQEWRRPDLLNPSFAPFTIELVLIGIGVLAWGIHRRRARPSEDVRLDDILVTAFLVWLALGSARHVMLVGIGGAPLIACGIAAVVTRTRSHLPAHRRSLETSCRQGAITARERTMVNRIAAAVIAVAIVAVGIHRARPAAQASAIRHAYPVDLLGRLDKAVADRPAARLFNEYGWGGFLILRRPAIPVFIDGRSEVYGDDQLVRYAQIAYTAPGWRAQIARSKIDLALIRRSLPLAAALRASGWHEIGSDRIGVLLARP